MLVSNTLKWRSSRCSVYLSLVMSVFVKAYLSITIYVGQPDSINHVERDCHVKYSERLRSSCFSQQFQNARGQRSGIIVSGQLLNVMNRPSAM